jgi:uncharacterized protein
MHALTAPMTSENPSSPQRIDAIDALRGFALAGVALVHFLDQFLAGPLPESQAAVLHPTALDQMISGLNQAFFVGKFYMLFSLLFGLSFFLQMDRAAQRGVHFGGRFAWRLVLLFGIGYLHHFLFRGDILMLYALLGMLLIPLFRVPGKVLWPLVAVLFLGAGRFLSFALFGGGALFGGAEISPASEYSQRYFEVLQQGSLADVFAINAVGGLQSGGTFQFGIFGRGYVTLALFLVGLWLGRVGFFGRLAENHRRIRRTLWIAAGAAVPVMALVAFLFMQVGEGGSFDSWTAAFALTAYDLFNLCIATVILCAFLLIYRRSWGEKALRVFAPYGRTALSNYILQSAGGTFLFYGWGLGLLGEVRSLYLVPIALAFIALQLAVSRVWLRHCLYGPLEWVWRSLTHLKVFPLRRPREALRHSP